MKKMPFIICCFAALALCSCSKRLTKATSVDIIPKVASLTVSDSTFGLSATTSIRMLQLDSAMRYSADFFNDAMKKTLGKKLPVNKTLAPSSDAINVGLDESYDSEEYLLKILPDRILIKGGSPRGVFYAFQTLRQILPREAWQGERARVIELPTLEIRDKPTFGYRGGMLDVARHFFSVDEVKQYIDILAMHKMNRFHWHLTDDQGWRIEIRQYPLLTDVGSVREKSLLNHARDSVPLFDDKSYGGYYTQAQIREVVKYAQERFITVIPEIEMPGHASAALAAYPDLGCVGHGYKVEPMWGILDEAFCAGKENTFTFLENVLSEVIELFPSEYINIGGDECRKERWKECPYCRERMHDEHLQTEEQLQSYFMKRIENFVNGKERKIIGWDEILEGGISPTATVMSWRGPEGAVTAARNGNYVVMAPTAYCYLDYYPTRNTQNEPLGIGGYLPIEKVYALDPYRGLNAREKPFILGVQGNLWTEYITTLQHVEYMVLPRLAAIAEVGWSYDGGKDFDDFKRRLTTMAQRYEAAGYAYGKHPWTDSTAIAGIGW